jgi:predicted porin
MRTLADYGLTFRDPPSGKAFGGDLRWETPRRGLTLGTSIESQRLDGAGPQGALHAVPTFMTAYYAEWTKGKWYVAGEYWRVPIVLSMQAGTESASISIDQRSWYPMVSYQLTRKLQVGTYYSHYINKAGDLSQPVNYSKDWALSGRYNFNSNFYAKVETHFLHGTGIGYYSETNPDGLKPNSVLLAARVGFTF